MSFNVYGAREIKVKILMASYTTELEVSLNKWLEENKNEHLVDIKFSQGEHYCSALLILWVK